jgi:tryptophan synthase alpha chain
MTETGGNTPLRRRRPENLLRARVRSGGRRRPLLSCYFPIGDPLLSPSLLAIYADSGVDVIEFGLPSACPYLDGPDVAKSMARALNADLLRSLDAAGDCLARLPRQPAALIMTYADLPKRFVQDITLWRDIDSLLVVGPASDQARVTLEQTARAQSILISCFVGLPIQSDDIAAANRADGYVMLQSTAGVTGPRRSLDQDSRDRIQGLRSEGVTAPILLGFGISSGQLASAALELGADGIVVGSHCLRAALDGPRRLSAALSELRRGLDA